MDSVRRVFDVFAGIVVVAGIMMLVRPGSKGPDLVTGLGQAFAAAVTGAVGASSGATSTPTPPAPRAASQTVTV